MEYETAPRSSGGVLEVPGTTVRPNQLVERIPQNPLSGIEGKAAQAALK